MVSTKVLCFVILAASAMVMLAPVGTASAESTSLCDFDPGTGATETCPEGTHRVTHIHEANLSGSKEKMVFASGTVECDVLFLGDATTPLAAPLVINGNFTYSNCSNGCTVEEAQFSGTEKEEIEEELETEVPLGSTIRILKKGHERGEVGTWSSAVVSCLGSTCTYINVVGLTPETAWGPLLALEANGEISIQGQEFVWHRGFFCPEKTLLYIRITPLTKLSIAR